MTTPHPTLPPLEANISNRAIQEIDMLYATAYADAALHDPTERPLKKKSSEKVNDRLANPRAMQQAIPDSLDFIRKEFDGSEQEVLLKTAFNNLTSLLKLRSMTESTPEERETRIQECLNIMAADQQKIADYVAQNSLPADCSGTFAAACSIATIKKPRQTWIEIAASRREQGLDL